VNFHLIKLWEKNTDFYIQNTKVEQSDFFFSRGTKIWLKGNNKALSSSLP